MKNKKLSRSNLNSSITSVLAALLCIVIGTSSAVFVESSVGLQVALLM